MASKKATNVTEELGIQLGRRERQIVEILYRLQSATVADVRANLPDPPTYSAVRGMLALLEAKGHVSHRRDGMRYVYSPVVAPSKARQSALRHLVSTFFEGSTLAAAAALLEMSEPKLSPAERKQISALIARREGEGK
jgi:BlaI family transcriptional regulator, penicillinase repressor